MKKVFSFLLAGFFAISLAGCASEGEEPILDEEQPATEEPTPSPKNPVTTVFKLTEAESKAAKEVQGFNQNFFKAVIAENPEKSTVVCSPLSASTLLSMVANASNSKLAVEIANTLGCSDVATLNLLNQKYLTVLPQVDKFVKFSSANAMWYHDGYILDTQFSKTMAGFYAAPVFSRNFETSKASICKEVNDWVMEKTENIIENMIDEVPEGAHSILVNALYFKGQWTIPFDKRDTKKMVFHGLEGEQTVDMMYLDEMLCYKETPTYQVVKLTVGEEKFEVFMLLPKDEINSFIADTDFTAIINDHLAGDIIKFHFPRFKYSPDYQLNLNPVLYSMGVTSIQDSEFIKIFTPAVETFHNIYQKSGIEFNEEGAEGVSCTMDMLASGLGHPVTIPEVKFDRPFVFLITEKTTGAMLFAGKVGKI